MHCRQLEGRVAVLSFDYLIADHLEIFAREFSDALFIFNEENCLRAAGSSACLAAGKLRAWQGGFFFDPWQVDLEARAAPGFAVNPDVTAALFHDSVNRCKPEARSFAFFFGRKKWLENMSLRFGVHAAAVVGNCEHHIFAWGKHGGRMRKIGVELRVGCLDRKAAAFRHRVTRIYGKI